MSKKFSVSMFDALKDSMAEQRTGGNFKDILKTTVGNNYLVRLIPNVNDISKTIYHYFNHGWKSLATGQFVSCLCPTTVGERCPICEERVRLYRGDAEDKENAKLLGRKEQWVVNIYVVDDPTDSKNNGEIKIFRYGKQIDKVIRDATEGIDKDELGSKIFDLTQDGCNLRIAVEKNDGGYPTYISSKFLRESAIQGMNDKKIDEVYEKLFKLDTVFEQKSAQEVKELLDTHYFCQVSNNSDTSVGEGVEVTSSGVKVAKSAPVKVTEPEVEDPSDSNESQEPDANIQSKLDDLMKDL